MQTNRINRSFLRMLGGFLILATLSLSCYADEFCQYEEYFQPQCEYLPQPSCSKHHGHRFFLGPEAVHIYRKNSKGSKQDGWLYGGRFIYEHRRRYCFYWGIEGASARGTLRGITAKKASSKSRLNDSIIEGRFGYTFQCKRWWKAEFTPFVGGGYLWEVNHFKKPVPIHAKIVYSYATVGFLSSITPLDCLTIGFNAKLRYIINPKCKISNDPKYEDIKQSIGDDHLQYRLELPILYYANSCWGITAIPFYEQRFYGGMAAERDFFETQLFNAGISLGLTYYY